MYAVHRLSHLSQTLLSIRCSLKQNSFLSRYYILQMNQTFFCFISPWFPAFCFGLLLLLLLAAEIQVRTSNVMWTLALTQLKHPNTSARRCSLRLYFRRRRPRHNLPSLLRRDHIDALIGPWVQSIVSLHIVLLDVAIRVESSKENSRNYWSGRRTNSALLI